MVRVRSQQLILEEVLVNHELKPCIWDIEKEHLADKLLHRLQWSLGRYCNYSKAKIDSLPTKATIPW